jgi:hydrogenase maturation protease
VTGSSNYWEELERSGPDVVDVEGVELRRGSRVRLHPRPGGDVFDLALTGRIGVIEGIEQDMEGRIQLSVTVEDDPGRDLGERRQPGHRFFFGPEEVNPVRDESPVPEAEVPRILVAGIGNVFLGDDGFGVELAGRLAQSKLPPGVDVADFGIRGMDLAYVLHDYDAVVLLDALARGQSPGTLYVIEPELDDAEGTLDTHGMDPVKVLALARSLRGALPRTLVVGCEPTTTMSRDSEDVVAELSQPVKGALDEAVKLVESLVRDLTSIESQEVGHE